jgi:hypothetical protein
MRNGPVPDLMKKVINLNIITPIISKCIILEISAIIYNLGVKAQNTS